MSSFLYFPKVGLWVRPQNLFAYAHWLWCSSRVTKKGYLRHLLNPRVRALEDTELSSYLDKSRSLNVQVSWIRYPRDSTHIQMFDWSNQVVCKMSKPGFKKVNREIALRKNNSKLPAPTLEAVSESEDAYVERWVEAKASCQLEDLVGRVLPRLNEALYDTSPMNKRRFVDLIQNQGNADAKVVEALRDVLSHLEGDYILVNQVHGDLTPSNIMLSSEREPTVIDWEYSRRCLTSYDAWLYFYSQRPHRCTTRELEDWRQGFLNTFRQVLCAGPYPEQIRKQRVHVLHLIHLIERLSYLRGLRKHKELIIEENMKKDIDYERERLQRVLA